MRPCIPAHAAAFALVFVAACASAPDYREARRDGAEGYASRQAEANRHLVTYTGGEGDSARSVRDKALLRAAELTLEQGGDWFEVANSETSEDTSTDVRFESGGLEPSPVVTRQCGLLGCTSRVEPATRFGTAQRIEETATVYAHSIDIIIHSGLKPLDNPRAYDAAQTAANLRASL